MMMMMMMMLLRMKREPDKEVFCFDSAADDEDAANDD